MENTNVKLNRTHQQTPGKGTSNPGMLAVPAQPPQPLHFFSDKTDVHRGWELPGVTSVSHSPHVTWLPSSHGQYMSALRKGLLHLVARKPCATNHPRYK